MATQFLWPNLWLGSGVPPLSQFEATGVNVALSVDGPWLEQRGRTWLEVTRQATTLACLSDSLLIFSRRLLDSKWVASSVFSGFREVGEAAISARTVIMGRAKDRNQREC